MPELYGRDPRTGLDSIVVVRDGIVREVVPDTCPLGPNEEEPESVWIAPAFWDIQTNGRFGVSFADPGLTVERVARVVRAHGPLGTARLCPTLISSGREATLHALRTIAECCDRHEDVGRMVLGVHLEGPYLSPADGYRGAHPRGAIRDPDVGELEAFQDASGGRIALLTLAPERPGAIDLIGRATAMGVVVAIGHTEADGPAIRAAAAAGARLSTHLGNGIAATLARHPNPIWDQAACDALWTTLIADGHHLGPEVLKVLVRAKTPERVILVSDASPLAGLPPGTYGEWAVEPSGRVVVAGTPYLAGAGLGLDAGLANLIDVGLGMREAIATVTEHPARLLGRPAPDLTPGEPANLVRLRLLRGEEGVRVELLETWVDGRPAVEASPSAAT
jgi:N-acetylglucosamine-6-phosphate deacetylase